MPESVRGLATARDRSGSAASVVRFAAFVAPSFPVPSMVVADDAATAFPATGEILSTDVVRRHPVRTCVRRPRPVTVVPLVLLPLRKPVTLDPHIVGAWTGRHAVRTRCRRLADANVEGNLRMGCRCRKEEQPRDRKRSKQCFHNQSLKQFGSHFTHEVLVAR